MSKYTLGKYATLLAIATGEDEERITRSAIKNGYMVYKGKVGSMDSAKIFASVETAAKKEGIISGKYRESHAIYHAALEAYMGICRGQEGLGSVLRSAGLLFSVVKGPRVPGDTSDGDWIAVVMYGSMGAPVKGSEHEVIGLGINPV